MADEQDFSSISPTDLATSSIPTASVPQFSTAEYAHIPGSERCRICNNLVSQEYYRVNGMMACQTCATEARNGQPKDSHAAFTRGLMLGIGAALVGMVLYATFTILTGWYLGYIALGVGYLVAQAIKKGANGLGGRRYQIAAVLLTYAAISIAAIPIGISYSIKHTKEARQAQMEGSTSSNGTTIESTEADRGSKHQSNLAALAFQLLMLGLASPFLELQDPGHGIIGLFILFIGLRIAWQLTASRPLEVEGPYTVSTLPS